MSIFRITKIILATAFIHVAFLSSILACSYADGSLSTTRYDYIKETAVIVLAEPYKKSGNLVDFHIREVLKGEFAGREYAASEVNTSCTVIRFPLNRETNLPPLLWPRSCQRRCQNTCYFLKERKATGDYRSGQLKQ